MTSSSSIEPMGIDCLVEVAASHCELLICADIRARIVAPWGGGGSILLLETKLPASPLFLSGMHSVRLQSSRFQVGDLRLKEWKLPLLALHNGSNLRWVPTGLLQSHNRCRVSGLWVSSIRFDSSPMQPPRTVSLSQLCNGKEMWPMRGKPCVYLIRFQNAHN